MNKVIISIVIACGLLLLDAPEAAAHESRDSQSRSHRYDSSDRYYRDQYGRESYSRDAYRDGYRRDYNGSRYKRAHEMPRWLKRDKSFRRWFRHSRLQNNRRLSWHQVFDIYRWEDSYYRHRRH